MSWNLPPKPRGATATEVTRVRASIAEAEESPEPAAPEAVSSPVLTELYAVLQNAGLQFDALAPSGAPAGRHGPAHTTGKLPPCRIGGSACPPQRTTHTWPGTARCPPTLAVSREPPWVPCAQACPQSGANCPRSQRTCRYRRAPALSFTRQVALPHARPGRRPWERCRGGITGHHCHGSVDYCSLPTGTAAAVGGARGPLGELSQGTSTLLARVPSSTHLHQRIAEVGISLKMGSQSQKLTFTSFPICPGIRQVLFLFLWASCHSLSFFAVFVGPVPVLSPYVRSGPLLSAYHLALFHVPYLCGGRALRDRRGRLSYGQGGRFLPYGVHPLRGVRVSEAAVPGPGSSSGTPGVGAAAELQRSREPVAITK